MSEQEIVAGARAGVADPAAVPGPAALASRPQSVLEEEREFFLRSLRDLEAEHDVGDIDDADYEGLKDDYTVRAADVLRQLGGASLDPAPEAAQLPETGPAAPPASSLLPAAPVPSTHPGRSASLLGGRRRRWVVVALVAVAAGSLAGWAVVSGSGARQAGQPVSGNAVGAERTAQLLSQAQTSAAKGDAVAALKDCRSILADDPNQPEALAEEGWLLAQTQQPSLQDQGLGDLTRAIALAPTDNIAHLYRGIVLLDLGRKATAVGDLQYYLSHGPDPQVQSKVQQALARAQSTTPAGAAPATSVPPTSSGSPATSVPPTSSGSPATLVPPTSSGSPEKPVPPAG